MKNSDKKIANIIEDSFRNGLLAKGYLEVVRSIQQRKAKLVIIAKDVDNTAMVIEIKRLCNKSETPIVSELDKNTIGKIVGLEISTGFVAVKVSGFQKSKFSNYLDFVAKAKSQ